MTDALVETRRVQYYGTNRNIDQEAKQLVKILKKDHVLQKGEYNLEEANVDKGNLWKSTTLRDYSGQRPAKVGKQYEGTNLQNLTHFKLGNESGTTLPSYTYRESTVREDYSEKPVEKPHVHVEDRTVNWPDMAPQFMTDRSVGNSEYTNMYKNDQFVTPRAPTFPRLDTSKMQLPINMEKTKPLRGVHVDLGCDQPNLESETEYAYGISQGKKRPGSSGGLTAKLEEAKQVTKMMKDMERSSHVFRGGDYNGIQQSMASTFSVDYDKTDKIPITVRFPMAAIMRSSREEQDKALKDSNEEEEDEEKKKLPKIIKEAMESHNGTGDAAEGTRYHTKAHFKFGTDDGKFDSVYTKDFMPGTKNKLNKPAHIGAPADSDVYHRDPSDWFRTTNKDDFSGSVPFLATKSMEERSRQIRLNKSKRHGHNLSFSYDPSWSTAHRQQSLFSDDYRGPPSFFQALEPRKGYVNPWNHLITDAALPYQPDQNKKTEKQDNFKTLFMGPEESVERRRWKDDQCKKRVEDGHIAHFTLGSEFQKPKTVTEIEYSGRPKLDFGVAPAGKAEKIAPFRFEHVKISANQEDFLPDPFRTSKFEGVVAKQNYVTRSLPALPVHHASIMKNDYVPLRFREFTDPQKVMLKQDEKLSQKPIEKTHFFHLDNTKRTNFETTASADYIKPELQSGKVYLSAR
ncbi:uncharacterized protein LOC106152695 [Lingula anatina]|uniref:Uncharacterized protein LOC106152695 n=1 Tax=Lingula anatina TaxID=7574 RepID=A0A1S3H6U2_LINAN|nr:uncharacterized protein LOC106152695 [Lingula anatina]|eukprot:XP_013381840.1 uncharacterized protein LOC106152695 [Lingula anatina]